MSKPSNRHSGGRGYSHELQSTLSARFARDTEIPFGDAKRAKSKHKAGSAAQVAGLRYEAQVLTMLEGLYGGKERLLQKPWIIINADHDVAAKQRLIQPDAILLNPLTIFEVKLYHTEEAYFQLSERYAPAVSIMYKQSPRLIIICRHFNAALKPPNGRDQSTIFDLDSAVRGRYNIAVWAQQYGFLDVPNTPNATPAAQTEFPLP